MPMLMQHEMILRRYSLFLFDAFDQRLIWFVFKLQKIHDATINAQSNAGVEAANLLGKLNLARPWAPISIERDASRNKLNFKTDF